MTKIEFMNFSRPVQTSNTFNASTPRQPKRTFAAVVMTDGRLQLGIRIWDTVNGNDPGGLSLTAQTADARLAARRIAPCFAPDSRMIMHATQVNGEEALMTSNIDGSIKTRLSGSFANIREPAWGPFEVFAW